MTEEETKTMRILSLETQLNKIKAEFAYVRLQRDALLEIAWLDLPSEPSESIAKWREEFEKGWERKEPPEPKPSSGVVLSRLFAMSENAEKAAEMSNAELAEELRRTIGDHTPMHELAYDLIEEVAARLESAGRPEGGKL